MIHIGTEQGVNVQRAENHSSLQEEEKVPRNAPQNTIEEIKTGIIEKAKKDGWKFGCFGYSSHHLALDGEVKSVPKGIKKIMDIVDKDETDETKKIQMKKIIVKVGVVLLFSV